MPHVKELTSRSGWPAQLEYQEQCHKIVVISGFVKRIKNTKNAGPDHNWLELLTTLALLPRDHLQKHHVDTHDHLHK